MDQSIAETSGSGQTASRGLVFFDFDNTLIPGTSWRLLHEQFNVVEEANVHYDQFRDGKVSFAEWGKLDASLWGGSSKSGIAEAAATVDRLSEVEDVITTLSTDGYRVGVVSGGVEQLIRQVLSDVSIDFLVANVLEVDDGEITGTVDMQVTSDGKADIFRQLATQFDVPLEQTVAVGNSASDFQPDDQGLQIGLNPSNKTARARSDVVIEGDSLQPVITTVHNWDNGS